MSYVRIRSTSLEKKLDLTVPPIRREHLMEGYQRNKCLIATAVRKETSSNDECIPQATGTTKRWNNICYSEDRFDKVNGRLPMNMIISQIARREDKIVHTPIESTTECIKNPQDFEDFINKQDFSNENIKPWKNKPQKPRNKRNPRIVVGPTVADVIQNKYSKMYRNDVMGKICVSKHPKPDIVMKDIDGIPLEGSEFPYIHRHAKAANLHVTWEDESPLPCIKTSEMSINAKSKTIPENISSLSEIPIDSKNINGFSPVNYTVSRFNELYSNNKLPDERCSLHNISEHLQNVSDKLDFCQESFGKVIKRDVESLEEKKYSSENCFLQPISNFVIESSPESRSQWDKYIFEQTTPVKTNFIESDHLPLSCDLFEPGNFGAESDPKELQGGNFFNLESPVDILQEKEIPQTPTMNPNEFKLFSQPENFFSPIISQKFNSIFPSKKQEVSVKETQRKSYITDPDDLLKTPTK